MFTSDSNESSLWWGSGDWTLPVVSGRLLLAFPISSSTCFSATFLFFLRTVHREAQLSFVSWFHLRFLFFFRWNYINFVYYSRSVGSTFTSANLFTIVYQIDNSIASYNVPHKTIYKVFGKSTIISYNKPQSCRMLKMQ